MSDGQNAGEKWTLSREEADRMAQAIVSQLGTANENAKGITMAGQKLAGVAFVIGHRESDEPRLLGELQSNLRQSIVEAFMDGWVPLGFVRWQSNEVGAGKQFEITTQMQPFPRSEQLGPWTREMLVRAVALVRSGFRPN